MGAAKKSAVTMIPKYRFMVLFTPPKFRPEGLPGMANDADASPRIDIWMLPELTGLEQEKP